MPTRCLILLGILALLFIPKVSSSQLTSFPSAEGFGRFSVGGRGGAVIYVTNLNISGPGSFRACAEAVGPRTCIFRVGGIIDFGRQEGFYVPPYLTIAGQTAPGDGIMMKGFELHLGEPGLGVPAGQTHDIIIRHLRIRPGDNPAIVADHQSFGALECWKSHDIIVDHVSVGWAWDDTMSCYEGFNVTFQWSLFSEGLDNESRPSMVGGGFNPVAITSHHNYVAHFNWRAPILSSGTPQFVNNVIYNTKNGAFINNGFSGEPSGVIQFVGNYYLQGPQAQLPYEPRIGFIGCVFGGNCAVIQATQVYVKGNYQNLLRPNESYPEDALVEYAGCPCQQLLTSNPPGFPVLPSQTDAQQARLDVLARAGATVPRRDSIDLRAVNSISCGQNASCIATIYPNGPFDTETLASYGGYPVYNSGPPYPDSDGDGMSDAWEVAHGLNPNNPADGNAIAANGYTNLENFLNELAGDTLGLTTPFSSVANLHIIPHTP